jgi:hypothetical protein
MSVLLVIHSAGEFLTEAQPVPDLCGTRNVRRTACTACRAIAWLDSLLLRWHETDGRVLAGEEPATQEDFVPHEDGSTDCLRWSLKPWHTAEGQIGDELLFIGVDYRAGQSALSPKARHGSAPRLRMPPRHCTH